MNKTRYYWETDLIWKYVHSSLVLQSIAQQHLEVLRESIWKADKSKTSIQYLQELYSCGLDTWASMGAPSNGSWTGDILYEFLSSSEWYSPSSISSLCGRMNTSSSELSWGGAIACRNRCPWVGALTSSWNRGHNGTQIKPSSPRSMQSLQWSSKRWTSPILIFEGSFHSKPSGVHSFSIQDDGSIASKPHEITCLFFPVIKPCSYMLEIALWIN